MAAHFIKMADAHVGVFQQMAAQKARQGYVVAQDQDTRVGVALSQQPGASEKNDRFAGPGDPGEDAVAFANDAGVVFLAQVEHLQRRSRRRE